MKNANKSGLRTWIELDEKKFEHNYRVFRSFIPKNTKLCAVVKSNAYGHGFSDIAKKVSDLGADFLAVDSVVEGIALRKFGIEKPILVLGYTLPENYTEASLLNISIQIGSLHQLKNLKKWSGKVLKIHIKIDSGMNRQGLLLSEQDEAIKIIKNLSSTVELEGMFTHFAAAKNPALPQSTLSQIKNFKTWIDKIKKINKKNNKKIIIHTSATSGALLYPEANFDMVRIGIGLYGMWPSFEAKEYLNKKIELKPILSWKTIVAQIKPWRAGDKTGYDFTEIATRDSKIAILPVGYWHGYSRKLSGIGKVLIKGKSAKALGRVSMDILVVDVTDIQGVKEGEEVVLIGEQGKKEITIYNIANWDDTSWYETATRLNPLIKKFWV